MTLSFLYLSSMILRFYKHKNHVMIRYIKTSCVRLILVSNCGPIIYVELNKRLLILFVFRENDEFLHMLEIVSIYSSRD